MPQPADQDATTIDPLADLMIGVAALFLVAAVVVAPEMARGVKAEAGAGISAAARSTWQLDGKAVHPFTATRDGVVLPERRFIPLAGLLADPGLPASIDAAKPMLLVIEAGGEDAAFFLEALAAKQGQPDLAIIRRAAAR